MDIVTENGSFVILYEPLMPVFQPSARKSVSISHAPKYLFIILINQRQYFEKSIETFNQHLKIRELKEAGELVQKLHRMADLPPPDYIMVCLTTFQHRHLSETDIDDV
jgi:hypothetical protein